MYLNEELYINVCASILSTHFYFHAQNHTQCKCTLSPIQRYMHVHSHTQQHTPSSDARADTYMLIDHTQIPMHLYSWWEGGCARETSFPDLSKCFPSWHLLGAVLYPCVVNRGRRTSAYRSGNLDPKQAMCPRHKAR